MSSAAMIKRERIERLLRRVIWPATHPLSVPLDLSVCRLPGEPVPLSQGAELDFEPFELGEPWGGDWATAWFKARGTVPSEFAGRPVVARIDLGFSGQPGFGGEALVVENGTPLYGVNPAHNTIPLIERASGGEAVDLLVEAAANPVVKEGPLEWPLLLPDYNGAGTYRLSRFDIAAVDEAMSEVLYDWTVLTELVDELGLSDRRSAEILEVLDRIARQVDLADLSASIVAKRSSWAGLLDRPTRTGSHQVIAVGHAHIDSAWLWPIRETKRKCARTFSTAVALMAGDPSFVFACSQAQQHAWIEEEHPKLFEKMRALARSGQFEPVGSMWVEADTNLPSGESLVRQLVFGKRYFLDRYGIETEDCWLPDAFGYSGNLPQILRAANVSRFLTQKLSWNEIDTFPHHTFWWEGIDGSRVLAHCPPTDTYNGAMLISELEKGERQFAEHGVSDKSLYLFGFGDGGGGPTPEMLERARRLADLDPLPRVRLGSARSFFEGLERDVARVEEERSGDRAGASRTAHAPGADGLPVWVGELYLERHRGVQTTQARSKLGNRRCEALLREAELWTAVGLVGEKLAGATERVRGAWETVLLHQFHDIIPGSSIHWVHRDSREAYAEVEATLTSVIEEAAAQLADRLGDRTDGSLLLLSSSTAERDEVLEVDLPGFSAPPGRTQTAANGRALVRARVPGSGWALLGSGGETTDLAPARADQRGLSNGLVTVSLDEAGNVSSIRDEVLDRELIAAGGVGNLFQLHHDLPNHFDAWDLDQGSFAEARDQSEAESVEVIEEGPLRCAVRVTRPIGRSSRLVQEIRLSAGSKRVDFVTEVDWQERHKLLKVAFPLAVRSPQARFEIQFGHLERPTHANTSWDEARFEVPAQRWAALTEHGFGVALMNDCKYGYDARGNVLRLSLLRGPGWPDPEADRGTHHFTYCLYPFAGEAGFSEMVHEAERLNNPIRVVSLDGPTEEHLGDALPSAGGILEVEGAMVSAIKLADDGSGDRVVRIYEPTGGSARALLKGFGRCRVTRVDLLERPIGEIGVVDDELSIDLRPFELASLRLAET